MDEYKSIEKYLNKKQKVKCDKGNSFFFFFISKLLICFILFLIFAISINYSSNFKDFVDNYVYKDNFMFSAFRKWYGERFGSILPESNFSSINSVFNPQFIYSNSNLFLDGVVLSVDESYLVPNLFNGVVVFIGNKDNYGNCVVLEDENLVNVWYCNLNNISVSMYDYVSLGSLLGEVNGNSLYLVFEKDGEFLNYKEFI